MGLKESADIARSNAKGKTNTELLKSFVAELRKKIFESSRIRIDEQYVLDELRSRIMKEKSMEIIKNKERCREAVLDILTLPGLGE